jgi:uncharacterized protein YraI
MKLFKKVLTAAGVVAFAAPTTAKADIPDISGFASSTIFTAATTGTVTVTFLFGRALFDSEVLLFIAGVGTQSTAPMFVTGQYANESTSSVASATFNVTAGQSLLFGICTDATAGGDAGVTGCAGGTVWYMGDNATDGGLTHTAVMTADQWNAIQAGGPFGFVAPAGTQVVGFEDLGGATTSGLTPDYDYNDVVFSFSNVSVVPEPGTMGLLALGLVGLSGAGLVRRRSAKKGK